MNYLFDTNKVLDYLNKSALASFINERYTPLDNDNKVCVSIVTVGELKSIALQSHWGLRRKNDLAALLQIFSVIDININAIIDLYAEIDAFSQGKLLNLPLGNSARNTGKNDLWIAATAPYVEAILITTDKDFNHLHEQFVEVVCFDSNKHK